MCNFVLVYIQHWKLESSDLSHKVVRSSWVHCVCHSMPVWCYGQC